ncbi:MAG: beta-propeller domain-containing protein, partial [Candidatus Thorarchaeota archaeon]
MSSVIRFLSRLSIQSRRRLPSLRGLFVFGTILGSMVFFSLYVGFELSPPIHLRQFSSEFELTNYIKTHQPPPLIGEFWFRPGINPWMTLDDSFGTPQGIDGTSGYSTTNVQVEGVDEPDSVKTDGQYIFTFVDTEIVVIRAYPVETAEEVTRFQPTILPFALFLHSSKMLVVLGTDDSRIKIEIYDVTDPQFITLSYWMTIDSGYQGARMIGNYLYLITSKYAQDGEFRDRPWVETPLGAWSIPANQIYYDPGNYDWIYQYKMIVSLDITDPEATPDIETILTGHSSCTLYSSLTNIYLAVSRFPFLSRSWFDRKTTIHRFQIHEADTTYQGSGMVPGFLINQFALDESESHLRVATTSWQKVNQPDAESWTQVSNVYILDMEMKIRGCIEGLAPGESIYSVRFLGDTGYLVTFFKTDPLFILDLSIPHAPRVMGELVIPGYSDYLHPLENGFLIGIGKDVATSGHDDSWWWYQGLKISLFNTTDPYQPEETERIVVGVRGTESYALNDHKAVLVDTQHNLLVLPVLLAEYSAGSDPVPSTFGNVTWQGAYVFS